MFLDKPDYQFGMFLVSKLKKKIISIAFNLNINLKRKWNIYKIKFPI